jgi:FkbM family methyltransferase
VRSPLSEETFRGRTVAGAKKVVRAGFNSVGYEISRYRPRDAFARHRQRLFQSERVDVVLDVGANTGQYAWVVRNDGFSGRVISFEPVAESFAKLDAWSAGDPNWTCHRLALGREDGEREIHVSENSVSSSFLPLEDSFFQRAPYLRYVAHETVSTARLDTVRSRLLSTDERVFLKLDVQGLELDVLEGAPETLSQVVGFECELSVGSIYDGQTQLSDLVGFLAARDFQLCAIEPSYVDMETGELLQLDGLFARDEAEAGVSRDPVPA